MCVFFRYTREAGVRSLERKIGAICRAVAVKVAEGHKVTKTKTEALSPKCPTQQGGTVSLWVDWTGRVVGVEGFSFTIAYQSAKTLKQLTVEVNNVDYLDYLCFSTFDYLITVQCH